jgi:hypothetical protein
MAAPGQKAALLTAFDNAMADDLQPLYSIEVNLERSPKLGTLCGAIVVFKLNTVDLGMEKALHGKHIREGNLQAMQEIQDEVNKQTTTMHTDPIYFREDQGRWVGWALEKALRYFDAFGGSATISLKSSLLRINRKRTSREVASLRSDLRKLFPEAWDMDRLLRNGYQWDPWTKTIRRGRIGAEMSKR